MIWGSKRELRADLALRARVSSARSFPRSLHSSPFESEINILDYKGEDAKAACWGSAGVAGTSSLF